MLAVVMDEWPSNRPWHESVYLKKTTSSYAAQMAELGTRQILHHDIHHSVDRGSGHAKPYSGLCRMPDRLDSDKRDHITAGAHEQASQFGDEGRVYRNIHHEFTRPSCTSGATGFVANQFLCR